MRKIAVWIMIEDFLLEIPIKQSKPHSISKITIKSITLTRHFSSADLSCLFPNATFASFISNFKYACDILQISSKLTWNSVAFVCDVCEQWFGWRFDWTQFEVMILSVFFFFVICQQYTFDTDLLTMALPQNKFNWNIPFDDFF